MDAKASKSGTSLLLDDYWQKLNNLKPDYLFISAGAHKFRSIDALGNRKIEENTTFSQAYLTANTQRIDFSNPIDIYSSSLFRHN